MQSFVQFSFHFDASLNSSHLKYWRRRICRNLSRNWEGQKVGIKKFKISVLDEEAESQFHSELRIFFEVKKCNEVKRVEV